MSYDIPRTPAEDADFILGILRAAGYDAHLVGGQLRHRALGGAPSNDWDIAVLLNRDEYRLLSKNLEHIVLPRLGYPFVLQHTTAYAQHNGFIADWRYDNINIIAYDTNQYSTVQDLVHNFDLNINAFYISVGGVLINPDFDGRNVRILNFHNLNVSTGLQRAVDRVVRFKKEYPYLNWEQVDDYIEHLAINTVGILND